MLATKQKGIPISFEGASNLHRAYTNDNNEKYIAMIREYMLDKVGQ